MTGDNQEPDEAENGVQWVVSCPRHGARAHLYLEGLKQTDPTLAHCSLEPGEFPPSCDRACMSSFQFHLPKGSGQAEPDLDLEDTVVDD